MKNRVSLSQLSYVNFNDCFLLHPIVFDKINDVRIRWTISQSAITVVLLENNEFHDATHTHTQSRLFFFFSPMRNSLRSTSERSVGAADRVVRAHN